MRTKMKKYIFEEEEEVLRFLYEPKGKTPYDLIPREAIQIDKGLWKAIIKQLKKEL